MDPTGNGTLWGLIKHLKQWLVNLNRAGYARKQQSVEAIRSVIVASRQTGAYLRQQRETGERCYRTEAELSSQWTRLGFELRDLGLEKLAKRCDVSGRYWSDSASLSDDFLERSDIGLESMERLARQLLSEL